MEKLDSAHFLRTEKNPNASFYLNRLFILIVSLAGFNLSLSAQNIPVSSNEMTSGIISRLEQFNRDSLTHSSHRPFSRADVLRLLANAHLSDYQGRVTSDDLQYLLDECQEGQNNMSKYGIGRISHKIDSADTTGQFFAVKDLSRDNNFETGASSELKPIFGLFYKTRANFIQADFSDFYLRLNPVFDFNFGKSNGSSGTTFKNIRGAELRGGIADRVYFYANIHETQEAYGDYVNSWIQKYNAVPGAGFIKTYQPSFLKNVSGFDYLNSQGIVGVRLSEQFRLQLGHSRHFIGDGYRSLFLSDHGANYFFLKLNTKVWIFDYQNLFAELNATGQRSRDELLPKKYFAAHHLSLNLTRWLNIGLFESVVFSRNNQFELQYLNPIIFYRTVEQMIGSSDNAMLGMDCKIKASKSVKLYGQLLFDEFKIKELLNRTGWWGNKFGLQAGIDYFNVGGVQNLDMKVEMNIVRPYTYGHRDSSASYMHYNQPLAHPLGANFREILCHFNWNPISKLNIGPKIHYFVIGEDIGTGNYGSNPSKSYIDRIGDYDQNIGQGDKHAVMLAGLDASYMIWHNLFIDASLFNRQDRSDLLGKTNETLFSFGLRMNIARRSYLF